MAELRPVWENRPEKQEWVKPKGVGSHEFRVDFLRRLYRKRGIEFPECFIVEKAVEDPDRLDKWMTKLLQTWPRYRFTPYPKRADNDDNPGGLSMSENVTMIPGAEDDLRASVEQLKRSLPVMAELATEVAKARRVNFLAHVDSGFTEAQALELCKSLAL